MAIHHTDPDDGEKKSMKQWFLTQHTDMLIA
jgi:hypothetical protein